MGTTCTSSPRARAASWPSKSALAARSPTRTPRPAFPLLRPASPFAERSQPTSEEPACKRPAPRQRGERTGPPAPRAPRLVAQDRRRMEDTSTTQRLLARQLVVAFPSRLEVLEQLVFARVRLLPHPLLLPQPLLHRLRHAETLRDLVLLARTPSERGRPAREEPCGRGGALQLRRAGQLLHSAVADRAGEVGSGALACGVPPRRPSLALRPPRPRLVAHMTIMPECRSPGRAMTFRPVVRLTRQMAKRTPMAVAVVAALVFAPAAAARPAQQPGAITLRVVFPEGFSARQMADRVAEVRRIEKRHVTPRLTGSGYARAVRSARTPRGFARYLKRRSVEGFLFPALYEFSPQTTAATLVQNQLAAFTLRWKSVDLSAARRRGRTPYDVLSIASMVERETVVPAERRLVAAVIHNRLDLGMPLGIDATLRYGLGIGGMPPMPRAQR